MILRQVAAVLCCFASTGLAQDEAPTVTGDEVTFELTQLDEEQLRARRVEQAIEFVRLGYGDVGGRDAPFRSLEFRTECLETPEIEPVIRTVSEYNAFRGDAVANALKEFEGLVTCYEFGRSASPILVVSLPYWTHQREGIAPGQQGTRISDADHNALVRRIRAKFTNDLDADETGELPDRPRTIYFWWD